MNVSGTPAISLNPHIDAGMGNIDILWLERSTAEGASVLYRHGVQEIRP